MGGAVDSETITIDPHFTGPSASGNGGVSAGLAAALLNKPAQVRLRRPPPLGRPLQVQRSEGEIQVVDAGDAVLIATEGTHPVDVPVDSDVLARTLERGPTAVFNDHTAPECYVCGHRSDGLRVCPHRLPDTDILATVWTPDASVSSNGRTVDPHIVWGALDSPAGFAVTRYGVEPMTFFAALTRMTTDIVQPVRVDHPVAVFGWLIDQDERRINGGTAIVVPDGTVLATAHCQHARLPVAFGTD